MFIKLNLIMTKLLKYQLGLYLFIILFTVQNILFEDFNFNWIYYEDIVSAFFIISFLTILISVALLSYQNIKSLKKSTVATLEIVYLIICLILYYVVIFCSLYLSTRIRF